MDVPNGLSMLGQLGPLMFVWTKLFVIFAPYLLTVTLIFFMLSL